MRSAIAFQRIQDVSQLFKQNSGLSDLPSGGGCPRGVMVKALNCEI